jgi:hypothetical protein
MSILSLDQYIASSKQRIRITKPSITSLAVIPFTVFNGAGDPGAGTLAGTSTGQGVVPDDTVAGFPPVTFTGGTGYLSRVEYGSTVACRLAVYDLLFKAGAYSYAAGTTSLSGQPSIISRCPDYPGSGNVWGQGNEIWLEVTTPFVTGNAWQVSCTYTNSNGVTGCTSPISAVFAAAALIQNRMQQIYLAPGDVGVQRIESVIVTNNTTAMTAGNFNILIARPLITSLKAKFVGDGGIADIITTGMPQVYTNSALYAIITADSTTSGVPEILMEIASA